MTFRCALVSTNTDQIETKAISKVPTRASRYEVCTRVADRGSDAKEQDRDEERRGTRFLLDDSDITVRCNWYEYRSNVKIRFGDLGLEAIHQVLARAAPRSWDSDGQAPEQQMAMEDLVNCPLRPSGVL